MICTINIFKSQIQVPSNICQSRILIRCRRGVRKNNISNNKVGILGFFSSYLLCPQVYWSNDSWSHIFKGIERTHGISLTQRRSTHKRVEIPYVKEQILIFYSMTSSNSTTPHFGLWLNIRMTTQGPLAP